MEVFFLVLQAVQLRSAHECHEEDWQEDTPSAPSSSSLHHPHHRTQGQEEEVGQQEEEVEWEPPDGGYGWVIVVTSFFNLIFFSSALMGFPVFFKEFKQNLGKDNSQVSIIGSIQTGFMFYFSKFYSLIIHQNSTRFLPYKHCIL